MPSTGDQSFSLAVSVAGSINVLPRRLFRASFPLPSPLLRALGPGEHADGSQWSSWLAEWGWTWAVASETCSPEIPLLKLWLDRSTWPNGFDARVLALAVALKLRVDGVPLAAAPRTVAFDLERVWTAVSALSADELGQVLALALLRADATVFNFDSVAPHWPADIGRVLAERRALADDRAPAPVWLKSGYAMLGEAFSLLRSMAATLKDCRDVWDGLVQESELPLAFEMAFWWEATYCLTERHAYEAAEEAQQLVGALAEKLEQLSGLVDPMWHHQQGRLYYYAGNYESALAEFLREYEAVGDDLKVAAMLNREIANVLSDLACFEAARSFAEKSVEVARSQGQHSELYKSLGRLAEIAIKLGDLTGAERLLVDSLSIQEKRREDSRSPAQTLTYLGHVALLKRDFDQVAAWYERATAKDVDQSSLPYITMGRFALAAATENAVHLDQLWNAHRELIEAWVTHQTHILPAAVCVLAAAHHVAPARRSLPRLTRALVANHYAVEAAYVLPALPEEEQSRIADDIVATLNRWQKALGSLAPSIRTGHLNGPAKMARAIRVSSLHDDAQLRVRCYPMSLV